MSVHQLQFTQKLPISLEQAWDFFSSPANLSKITPPDMGFVILSEDKQGKTYQGQIIIYEVSPLWGIPMDWVTEITHCEKPNFFVDEQRFGPYALWHHQHHFKKIDGGVEMSDILTYKLKFGVLGRLLNKILVEQKIKTIFNYRKTKLESLFN